MCYLENRTQLTVLFARAMFPLWWGFSRLVDHVVQVTNGSNNTVQSHIDHGTLLHCSIRHCRWTEEHRGDGGKLVEVQWRKERTRVKNSKYQICSNYKFSHDVLLPSFMKTAVMYFIKSKLNT